MKYLSAIFLIIIIQASIFSQTDNIISLEKCMESAINIHPLQNSKNVLNEVLTTQNSILDKVALPTIIWNAQVRVQSESIGLEFDNPMIPSIEIPLYSAQTTLDAKYFFYDGGMRKAAQSVNKQYNLLQKEKIDNTIDQIKKDVLQQYLMILFLDQKKNVLQSNLELIRENIKTLSAGLELGVVNKTDLQQIIIKEKELISELEANSQDIKTGKKVLTSLTGIIFDEAVTLDMPELNEFIINETVSSEKTQVYDLQKQWLEAQKEANARKYKPKAFAFLTGGTGYPNPLNFFDDQVSLYAMGGLGFNWNFLDWGKQKEERQLIQLQQELVDSEEHTVVTTLNRYNDRFKLSIHKYERLMNDEKELIQLKKEIAETQHQRLEEGVILPIEYLNNLNEIIRSELNLSRYELEIIKLKLEYELLKGNL